MSILSSDQTAASDHLSGETTLSGNSKLAAHLGLARGLDPREDAMFKIQIACAALASRRAEADFMSALAAEARVSADIARASAETASALFKTLLRRKSEAQVHERYYCRLYQIASNKADNAETDATQLKEQGRELGLNFSPIDGMPLSDLALFGAD
ncbi:hypothetical protein C8R44DRAFT_731074 [Mycena epipterygia]|nr:hypothetical protein C8R44DRAFT_731074 [Mycena epipterygia]